MKDDILRKEVKMLKALQEISYKEIAYYLEIKQSSFYSWLSGQYDFGYEKQRRLQEVLDTLKE